MDNFFKAHEAKKLSRNHPITVDVQSGSIETCNASRLAVLNWVKVIMLTCACGHTPSIHWHEVKSLQMNMYGFPIQIYGKLQRAVT